MRHRTIASPGSRPTTSRTEFTVGTTGLRERQISKFVENDKVHTRQIIDESALPAIMSLSFERLTRSTAL
jgi:hypothetical protein